jgi:hypothetical protein
MTTGAWVDPSLTSYLIDDDVAISTRRYSTIKT